MGSNKLSENVSGFLFEYKTPRLIALRDKRVGLIFRLIQLVVLAYVVGWVFIYEKGYQSTGSTISSVSVKVKGFGFTNLSSVGPKVLDVVDYTFPSQAVNYSITQSEERELLTYLSLPLITCLCFLPKGSSSFVIMTNYILTRKQSMKFCGQHRTSGECGADSDCPTGKFSRYGQGMMSGSCRNNSAGVKTCEIFGWCPVEDDLHLPNPPLLMAAENFTIFIKNSVTFTAFGVSRRNLVEFITKAYLRNCTYHKVHHPLCPVFRLGHIAEEIKENFSTLAYRGAMIGIVIDWDCDLDWPVTDCKPTYSFHQHYRSLTKDQVSVGFNFRYAKYYVENGTEMRDLYKVFGIRFDVMVHGKAGKFNIIPTMTTIGSGIGVFGVATIVCDLVLLHLLPKRNYYKQKKFKNVESSLRAGSGH
ncbi:P2X purinoceptor 1 [Leucoraja erinacea]|uniref:P2X purinoceptor 1 n=1 Tax=Leucoraja erinaceus TaxID=7782 RepID=UPI002457061E|nr:P2X purinoceptor 1 [Leucoraja erinacea]